MRLNRILFGFCAVLLLLGVAFGPAAILTADGVSPVPWLTADGVSPVPWLTADRVQPARSSGTAS